MLARYPEAVVRNICDPVRGLPSTAKWLPAIAEIREACEREIVWHDAVEKRDRDRAHTRAVLAAIRPRWARLSTSGWSRTSRTSGRCGPGRLGRRRPSRRTTPAFRRWSTRRKWRPILAACASKRTSLHEVRSRNLAPPWTNSTPFPFEDGADRQKSRRAYGVRLFQAVFVDGERQWPSPGAAGTSSRGPARREFLDRKLRSAMFPCVTSYFNLDIDAINHSEVTSTK